MQQLIGQFGLQPLPKEELERITVPTTLVWGRHNLVTRLGVAEATSARYGWPLHVIDGAADDAAIEQPEAFVKTLRSIFAAAPGAAAQ
jgi:pimeloyl-ACP methyl ester carboxylesterase